MAITLVKSIENLSGASTVHAPAFTTDDDGHALIITSPRPVLVATPDVQNDGDESVTYELYRAQVSTTDPDDDAWRLVGDAADVATGETATVDELVNAHAIMLIVKSADAGVSSDDVVASLTGTA